MNLNGSEETKWRYLITVQMTNGFDVRVLTKVDCLRIVICLVISVATKDKTG
jgi:hypothetical protein